MRERNAASRHPLGPVAIVMVLLAGLVASFSVGYLSPYSTTVPQAVFLGLACFDLYCLALVDAAVRRLPDLFVIIFVLIVMPALFTGFIDPLLALLGAVVASGVPFLVASVMRLLGSDSDPIGAGDIKLLAALGLFLGYKVIYVLGIACLLALAVSGIMRLVARGHDGTFPFGPYLTVATWAMLLIA